MLESIVQEPGMFFVNLPTMSMLNGQITILRDFEESAAILLGSLKQYEHFEVLRSTGDNFKLPKGK